ncbi:MAG TPA: ferritin-like domain-containing protein [Chroococcales cyanobacterium]|jgi:hypothetical protein
MKYVLMAIGIASVIAVGNPAYGQKHGNTEMMEGQCPMCGGPWSTPRSWNGEVPATLPRPKNPAWVTKLQGVLAIEKHSQSQYEADESKYRVMMPYRMIIPQEKKHIQWIQGIFQAYGLPSDGKKPPIKPSSSVEQAYQIGQALEADLIPRYVWLIRNAEDEKTRQVLDTILLQSRMHHAMFTHALEMGMGMGR